MTEVRPGVPGSHSAGGPSAASGPPSISYLPGRLAALVGDGVAVLAEADPAGTLFAACQQALARGRGASGVLEAVTAVPPLSFALAARDRDGVRVVVGGRARVEFADASTPALTIASASRSGTGAAQPRGGASPWAEQRLVHPPDLRLSVDGPLDPQAPLLPIVAGVVLAAAVVVAAVAGPDPDPDPETIDTAGTSPASGPRTDPGPPRPEPDGDLPWRPHSRGSSPEGREPDGRHTVVAPLPAGYPDHWVPARATPGLPASPPSPAPEPMPSYTPSYVAPAVDAASPTADVPMVQAVMCANSHLNAPFVVGACRVCGAPVPAQAPFPAPRPTLGVLVLPSGETVDVDRDVLLGRAPFSVDQDSVRLVSLPSPNNDLSRSHVRVFLDGWLVQVVDLGSTNGTVATMPGQQPVRLRAHDPFVLVPGTLVNLADEALLRFEVAP